MTGLRGYLYACCVCGDRHEARELTCYVERYGLGEGTIDRILCHACDGRWGRCEACDQLRLRDTEWRLCEDCRAAALAERIDRVLALAARIDAPTLPPVRGRRAVQLHQHGVTCVD